MVVVLPTPLTPTISTTVGLPAIFGSRLLADGEDARRLGAERVPHGVGVAELVLLEPLAQAPEDRLRRLHADVAREHDLFHLLEDGRVDLFLAGEERAELRDEPAARGGEAFAEAGDVALRSRRRRRRHVRRFFGGGRWLRNVALRAAGFVGNASRGGGGGGASLRASPLLLLRLGFLSGEQRARARSGSCSGFRTNAKYAPPARTATTMTTMMARNGHRTGLLGTDEQDYRNRSEGAGQRCGRCASSRAALGVEGHDLGFDARVDVVRRRTRPARRRPPTRAPRHCRVSAARLT